MTELQRSETRTEQQLRQLETELGQQKAHVSQVGSQVTEVRSLSEETIRLIVTFGFDKWQPDDRAQTVLRNVVNQLRENPSLTVDLEGYTDIIGPLPYHLQLSQRRVEVIQRLLAERASIFLAFTPWDSGRPTR